MPNPRKGETEEEFISRCIQVVMQEGLTQKQALGKCYGIWTNSKGDKWGQSLVTNFTTDKGT